MRKLQRELPSIAIPVLLARTSVGKVCVLLLWRTGQPGHIQKARNLRQAYSDGDTPEGDKP